MRGGKRKGSGRKAGEPNKVTREVREVLASIFAQSIPQIEDSIRNLETEPEKYLSVWAKLLPFFAPRLSTVQVIDAPDWVDFVRLSQAEKQSKIIELKNELSES